MNSDFVTVLDECLTRLRAGESVEACLADYTQHADALRPLLVLAAEVAALPTPQARSQAVEDGRQKMLTALHAKKQAVEPTAPVSFRPWSRYTKRLGAGLRSILASRLVSNARPVWRFAMVVAVMLFVVGAPVLVAASADSLPGDALYPVKRFWEQVQLSFTLGERARQELEQRIAEERRQEVQRVRELRRQVSVEFEGQLQVIQGDSWFVEGFWVLITGETVVEGVPTVGAVVAVKARVQDGGALEGMRLVVRAMPTPVVTATPSATATTTPTATRPLVTPSKGATSPASSLEPSAPPNTPQPPPPIQSPTPKGGRPPSATPRRPTSPPTPSSTAIISPTVSPTATATPTVTATPILPTATPSGTIILPTMTPPTPTVTAAATPGVSPTPIVTSTPTATATPTPMPTTTPTVFPTPTATATPIPSSTVTPTATATPDVTPTPTSTPVISATPTTVPASATPVPSSTPTAGPTPSPTPETAPTLAELVNWMNKIRLDGSWRPVIPALVGLYR